MSDEARLHIDDDWKTEALREKERLAQEVERSKAGSGLPEASFLGILNTLVMQAMVGLGGMAGPGGRAIPPNPELAKHYIDLLDVLDAKTRGNLTEEEKKTLDMALYNLRMAYVELMSGAGAPPPQTA
jgi:hypothetical protein